MKISQITSYKSPVNRYKKLPAFSSSKPLKIGYEQEQNAKKTFALIMSMFMLMTGANYNISAKKSSKTADSEDSEILINVKPDEPKEIEKHIEYPTHDKERLKLKEELLLAEKPVDIVDTRTTGQKIIDLASEFLGLTEEEFEEKTDYELPDDLWCAAFVKYIMTEVLGGNLPEWYENSGYNKCEAVLSAAKDEGKVFYDFKEAKPGDIIIFRTKRSETGHMGIFKGLDENNFMSTIEGNAGDDSIVKESLYNMNETKKVNCFIRLFDEDEANEASEVVQD